jgi:hypothetical protein
MTTHAPLSYSRWDSIGDGDSDDEPKQPKPKEPLGALGHAKSKEQHDADGALYDRFRGHLKTHFKGTHSVTQRKLVARFIAVQHKMDQSSNVFRYNDIIGLAAQRQDELMERGCVNLLCELHKAMLNQEARREHTESPRRDQRSHATRTRRRRSTRAARLCATRRS